MEEIQLAENALKDSKVALKKAEEQVGFTILSDSEGYIGSFCALKI